MVFGKHDTILQLSTFSRIKDNGERCTELEVCPSQQVNREGRPLIETRFSEASVDLITQDNSSHTWLFNELWVR